MKISGNCKLCKLLKDRKKLFEEVHTMILVENRPKARVIDWLNKEVDIINASLKIDEEPLEHFNDTNFHTHFKKHVGSKKSYTELILQQEKKYLAKEVFSGDEAIIAGYMEDQKNEEDLKDYLEIEEIVEAFDKTLKIQCYQALEDRENLNIGQLKQLQELVINHAKLRKDISSARKSDNVVGAAIERLSKDLTKSFLGKLKEIAKEAGTMIADQTGSEKFAKEVNNMIFEQVKRHLQTEGMDIVRIVKKVYKIK